MVKQIQRIEPVRLIARAFAPWPERVG